LLFTVKLSSIIAAIVISVFHFVLSSGFVIVDGTIITLWMEDHSIFLFQSSILSIKEMMYTRDDRGDILSEFSPFFHLYPIQLANSAVLLPHSERVTALFISLIERKN